MFIADIYSHIKYDSKNKNKNKLIMMIRAIIRITRIGTQIIIIITGNKYTISITTSRFHDSTGDYTFSQWSPAFCFWDIATMGT